jgi:hypothetical protein
LDERSGLADERATSGFGDNGIAFASLAASRVVADVTHVFVDGQGLSGDGRLISGDDRGTDMVLIVIVRVSVILGVVTLWVVDHFLVFFKPSFVVKSADQAAFAGNDGTLFENDLERQVRFRH